MAELITPPETEPVTVAAMRTYLIIETSEHDTLLAELIAAARDTVERDIGQSLIETEWRQYLDRGKSSTRETVRLGADYYDQIILDRGPVMEITDLELSGVADDASDWLTTGPHRKAVYAPVGLDLSAIKIDYTAGYSEANLIPPSIIRAIKMLVAHWFQNRQAYEEGSMEEVKLGYNKLVSGFKQMVF